MDIFQTLADPTRRKIIGLLKDHSGQSTTALASKQSISRQAVSKHLKVLIDNRIVNKSQVGKYCLHTLNPEPLKELEQWLKPYAKLWDQRLTDLQTFLEEKHGK